MKKVLFICALSSISVLAFAGCGAAPAAAVGDTVALDEFDTLDVEVSSYDLTITVGDSYSIEYNAESGREPKISQSGGKLTITQPSRTFFNLFGSTSMPDAYYKITVPEGASPISLTAKASSAEVTIDRVDFSGKIKTSSGDVMLNDIEGNIIEVETGSGKACADKIRAGAVSFGTSSGDVELLRIEADDISCNTSSGEVGINNSVGKNVMCQTSSGAVDVELLGSTDGYSYYVDTSSGDISVNGQQAKKEYVKDDGPGGKVAVHTSSGDVNITVQEVQTQETSRRTDGGAHVPV